MNMVLDIIVGGIWEQLLSPFLQFLWWFKLIFVGFASLLVFVIVRKIAGWATETFRNEVGIITALIAFYWLWANFLIILGLGGLTLVLFYIVGIPLTGFMIILVKILGD